MLDRKSSMAGRGIEVLNCVETGKDLLKKKRQPKSISILEKTTSLMLKYPEDWFYQSIFNRLTKTGRIPHELSKIITWEYLNK